MRLFGIIFMLNFAVIAHVESYILRSLKAEKPTGHIRSDNRLKFNGMQHNNMAVSSNVKDFVDSTPPEQSIEGLSKVKAVRYFINLTNGIEIIPTLLKQGVPMEHINVSLSALSLALKGYRFVSRS